MNRVPNSATDIALQSGLRRSVPARSLGEPGPDDAGLTAMLRAAVRVPDHGRRVPFRFLRIAGPARHSLGNALAEIALRRDPGITATMLEKDRQRFAHAPLVIAVIAVLDATDTKIPAQERILSAGCVCFALLEAAQASGYGAQWLTGWPAYDPEARALLGVGEQECVVGFIHIGTPQAEVPERERPDPLALLSDWGLA